MYVKNTDQAEKNSCSPEIKMNKTKNNKRVWLTKVSFDTFPEKRKENDLHRKYWLLLGLRKPHLEVKFYRQNKIDDFIVSLTIKFCIHIFYYLKNKILGIYLQSRFMFFPQLFTFTKPFSK